MVTDTISLLRVVSAAGAWTLFAAWVTLFVPDGKFDSLDRKVSPKF
jgi:hypothetical protein